MKTVTIRGIDDQLADALKKVALDRQESMNQTIIKLLKASVGLSKKKIFPKYDDLDALAGTWSVNEEHAFYKNTQSFEEIDKEIWD